MKSPLQSLCAWSRWGRDPAEEQRTGVGILLFVSRWINPMRRCEFSGQVQVPQTDGGRDEIGDPFCDERASLRDYGSLL
jgi:hypothetical protein